MRTFSWKEQEEYDYKIPCCWREINRALKATTRRGKTEKSAEAQHALEKRHHPSRDQMAILDQARNTHTLLIEETFHISIMERRSSWTQRGVYNHLWVFEVVTRMCSLHTPLTTLTSPPESQHDSCSSFAKSCLQEPINIIHLLLSVFTYNVY